MKNLLFVFSLTVGLVVNSVFGTSIDYTRFVDPFIGCAENGHTFPGACCPFGTIQVGPDTGNGDWSHCSGYLYRDPSIGGFSQDHLNGTGNPELGDILLQPFAGGAVRESYCSAYDKTTQSASPGFYGVTLSDFNVKVELTAAPHVAFHRYTYGGQGPARLLIDCQYGVVSSEAELRTHITASDVRLGEDHTSITGYNCATSWVARQVFFALKLDKPYTSVQRLPVRPGEKAPRYALDFDLKPGESLQVKVALSTVSVAGAEKNMADEVPGWNFAAVRERARQTWNDLLGRAEMKARPISKKVFTRPSTVCLSSRTTSRMSTATTAVRTTRLRKLPAASTTPRFRCGTPIAPHTRSTRFLRPSAWTALSKRCSPTIGHRATCRSGRSGARRTSV